MRLIKTLFSIPFLLLILFSCQKKEDIETRNSSCVVIHGDYAYFANGERGIQVINLETKGTVALLSPFFPARSIDDLCLDGNLLFALDAEVVGYISVYNIENPAAPKLLSSNTKVPVEPFSGISANNGNVVVSGGTKYFSHKTYNAEGEISKGQNRLTRDQGHPDVLLSNDGNTALISTHFEGSRFGIISAKLTNSDVEVISEIIIPGAGFTTGTTDLTGFPIKSALYQNSVLVAHGAGLTIFDLNNNALTQLIHLNLNIEAVNITVHNDFAYVIGYSPLPTLVKVDIKDLNSPSIIESTELSTAGDISSIAVSDKAIFITAGESGILSL
jgi:hypothetical protein